MGPAALLLALLLHLSVGAAPPHPAPAVIDVARQYGDISFASIRGAMEHAQGIVASGGSAVIFLAAGEHTVDMAGGALFDVSGVTPGPGRRLVVAGAGMDKTTLVTRTHANDVIHAHRAPEAPMWRRVSFENMTFAREGQATTQGRLVAADEHGVELEVVEGFPPLDELMQLGEAQPSMWFRRYTFAADAGKNPRLVTDEYDSAYWKPLVNQQVRFSCCSHAAGANATCQRTASSWVCPDVQQLEGHSRRWRLAVSKWPDGEMQRYREALRDPNQRIAIKIKHGGQSYRMQGGDDVAFVNVRWLGHSRGAIIDTSSVLFRNTRVDRLPPPAGSEVPLLATNAGGPQILGNSRPVINLTVVNHTSTATGDDSLALFNVESGLVSGCHIRDAFGRGIVLCSATVRLSDNELVRNPLFIVNASSYSLCLCTSNPRAGPELPQCRYPNATHESQPGGPRKLKVDDPVIPVRLCGCTANGVGQLWDLGAASPSAAATSHPWRLRNAGGGAQCVDGVGDPTHPGGAPLQIVSCAAAHRNFSLVATFPGGGGPRVVAGSTSGQQLCVDANYGGPQLQVYHCNHVLGGAQDFRWLPDGRVAFHPGERHQSCVTALSQGDCPAPPAPSPQPAPPAPKPPPGPRPALPLLYPRYHLTMPDHWAQDPSGTILINGTWHLFADSCHGTGRPADPNCPGLYWAHATSSDLVRWVGGRDFVTLSGSTGSIVPYSTNGGTDDVEFHSIDGFGSHHIASDASLAVWTKAPFAHSPKASHPGDPAGLFRVGDPSRPFFFDGEWLMIVGGGANGGDGTWATAEARLYKAVPFTRNGGPTPPALSNWSYVGIAFASNVSAPNPNSWGPWNPQNPTTGMFECIDFFRIADDRWMLMASQISEGNDAFETHPQKLTESYWIGHFDGRKFTPVGDGVGRAIDFGYVAAAKTGGDLRNDAPSSRRVFFGWNDCWTRFHGAKTYSSHGWKGFSEWGSVTQPFGSQVLPRDLWLEGGDDTLRIAPVPELQSLRRTGQGEECHVTSAGEVAGFLPCTGRQLELNATIVLPDCTSSSAARLVILASSDGRESTTIELNCSVLTLDRRNSSLTPDATDSGQVNNWFPQNRTRLFAPLQEAEVRAEAPISLRAYVDGSVIEIFVNERVALTGLVFPVLEDSVHVRVDGAVAALSVWRLESTSPVVAKPTPDRLKSDDDDDALLGHVDDVGTGSLKYLTWYNAPGDGDWLTQTHSNLLTNENLDHMMGKYTDPNNVTFDPFFMLDLHRPGPRSEPWWIQPKQWDQPGGGLRPGWDVDMAGELEKALPHIVSGKVVGIFLG